MSAALPENLLGEFSTFISRHMGLHFPRERWPDLERGVAEAARGFGFAETAACIEWLLSSRLTRGQIEILASHLTVGETYLFRDTKLFAILEEQILPQLIRTRRGGNRRLRLWSAGCCTGEEPYSMAIALSRALPDWRDWNVTVLGTDINPAFLRKAQAGVYGDWSFRSAPAWLRNDYFRCAAKGRFEVVPHVKKMVTFGHLNLSDDGYPSLVTNTNAMDVVFCRNVLIYFGPERAREVIEKLHHALVAGGWLFVGASEVSQAIYADFETVLCDGATVYRKRGGVPLEAGTLAPVVPALLPSSQSSPDAVPRMPLTPKASASPRPVPSATVPAVPSHAIRSYGEKPAAERPEPAHARAAALFEEGRYAEAVAALLDLCARGQGSQQAMALLARACANKGDLAAAREWAEKAIAADKLDPRTHYLRAVILCEQGESEAATGALQRALYLDQDFVLAHFTLANLAQRQGKPHKARAHFDVALSLLHRCAPDELLPEAEGLTAGRLAEIIRGVTGQGGQA